MPIANYECLFLLDSTKTSGSLDAARGQLHGILEKYGAEILASRPWSDIQKRWLRRIEEQMIREVVVDRDALDDEPFRSDGGFQRMNKIFDAQLEAVLADLNEELWKKAA